MNIRGWSVVICSLVLVGCGVPAEQNVPKPPEVSEFDVQKLGERPAMTDRGFVNAVIEIPAGVNHKYEYDYENDNFPCDQQGGSDRIIKFLPYIGNYGFIPSTYMDPAEGGDGDALDILVLSETVQQGTIMEVEPVAVLHLLDGGEVDDKIIALPADLSQRTVQELDSVITGMMEQWFLHYKDTGEMQFVGWGTAEDANASIEQWIK